MPALRPAVRPTSSEHIGPAFCHNACDRCLIIHCYFDKC